MVEKIIEVPTKIVEYVKRVINVEKQDDSILIDLEKENYQFAKENEELNTVLSKLIEEKNTPREEIVEVKKIIIKHQFREVEITRIEDGGASIIKSKLGQLNFQFENLIQEFYNLKSVNKELIVKTVEIPYETIKYIDKEIEVLKPNTEKIVKLEEKLKFLKKEKEEISKIFENIPKPEPQERVVIVHKDFTKVIERNINKFKINDLKIQELENKIKDAASELSEIQNKCNEEVIIKEKIVQVPKEVIKFIEYPVEIVRVNNEVIYNLSISIGEIKKAMKNFEIKNDHLKNLFNCPIEKITEIPKEINKTIERQINVIKPNMEKISELERIINNLKLNVQNNEKEFEILQKNKVIEKKIEVPVEVVKYIDRPIEIITVNENSMKIIDDQLSNAYSLLKDWKEKIKMAKEERLIPYEMQVEVDIVQKKFFVNRSEIHKSNEKDVELVNQEIEKVKEKLLKLREDFAKINENAEKEIVIEKRIEKIVENFEYIDVPTEILTITPEAEMKLLEEIQNMKSVFENSQ